MQHLQTPSAGLCQISVHFNAFVNEDNPQNIGEFCFRGVLQSTTVMSIDTHTQDAEAVQSGTLALTRYSFTSTLL